MREAAAWAAHASSIAEFNQDQSGLVHQPASVIHIEFDRVRVRVEGPTDPVTLRIILDHLGR